MSIIKKIDTFSSDDRGEIIDIFSKDPKEHCTIVTFNQNAVRGNHYHKKSIQSAYVLEGDFKIFNVKIDKNSSFDPVLCFCYLAIYLCSFFFLRCF